MTSINPAKRATPPLFWSPGGPRPHEGEEPHIEKFRKWVNARRAYDLKSYWDLHRWSVSKTDEFWSDCWDYFGFVGSKGNGPAHDRSIPMNKPQRWFPGASFNFSENLLLSHPNARSPTATAVIGTVEPDPSSSSPHEPVETGRVSWAELYDQVGRAVVALRKLGVKPGDSVVTFGASNVEMVVVYLAVIAVGAIFSSTPAEFGSHAVIDRYSIIKPKVLFTIDKYRYGRKEHLVSQRAREVVDALVKVGGIEHVIVIGHLVPSREPVPDSLKGFKGVKTQTWNAFLKSGNAAPKNIEFHRADFSWPIWIVFSSGTTGKPKSILGPGGGLLLSRKMTNMLHMNLDHRDTVLQFSTMGWIVYNLSVNFLATGGTMLCYDGSPFHPQEVLWRLVEKYKVAQLGISPRYIQSLARNRFVPSAERDISSLKQVYTTGAPITGDVYDYIAREVPNAFLSNNCGGTEIGGGLLHSVHTLPVYRGELQVPILGIDLAAFDDNGKPVYDQEGTMVIRTAFPNMPVGFVGDEGGKRYQETYFSDFPSPVFNMNDNVYMNSVTGGTLVLGRSDGVLNPSGVRFGSAELYYILEKDFRDEIVDSIAVGQKTADNNERVALFVVLPEHKRLDKDLVEMVQKAIQQQLSRRHVPEIIEQCPAIPSTMSNKKLE
ncbi:acetyl-CoA synthetase-like protein, partial [Atractiella rhizophila]